MNKLACGIVLGAFAVTAQGQIGANRDKAPVTARQPSVLRTLNQTIFQVSFEEQPLDQVIEWLQTQIEDMNVVVRWNRLEDLGVERDKPVTINARNLRVSQVLWMILNEAGGADVKLAYRAAANLMVISTADDLGQEMLVRVYDVSDLLVNVPRFTNAPQLDLAQAGQGGGAGGAGGGGSQNIFGQQGGGSQQDDEEDENQDDEDIQALITLIVDTIEPDSWAQNGGLGTVQPFRNQLVVRNNILVHQKLGGAVISPS